MSEGLCKSVLSVNVFISECVVVNQYNFSVNQEETITIIIFSIEPIMESVVNFQFEGSTAVTPCLLIV